MRFLTSAVLVSSMALLLYLTAPGFAQVCPAGEVNTSALMRRITESGRQYRLYSPDDPDNSSPSVDATIIYGPAAIGGRGVVPDLRRIARQGMPADNVPGAFQVSAARLGDETVLAQIEQEINRPDPVRGWLALHKVEGIGNDEAVVTLINCFVWRSSDDSRPVFLRGAYYDSLLDIMLAPEKTVRDRRVPSARNLQV
jgi:hypothetical protein